MRYVLIADDHAVTRRGLREILKDAFDDLEIVETADGAGVLAALPTKPWDLLLLDIMMPGTSVLELLKSIRRQNDAVPVLILTAVTEPEYVIQTLAAGANGFIHKQRAVDELLQAIHRVTQGGKYLDSENALAVADALGTSKQPELHEKLSGRELEILCFIASGRAVKEIAADLSLSDKTVATYLARIREKTGLSSYVEIARYALQHGLVD